jgi:tetratricopeptide (TPR) repeat protein
MGMKTKAAVYAGIGVFLAAIPSFSQSTLSKQQQIESHSRRAQEFLKANKPNLAAREFGAILELDPNNLDARGNLGVTLFFQGDYDKAAGHLRGALQRQPMLWKIQALLGMCEKRMGQTASAQADLEKSFPELKDPKLRIQAGMELIEIYYGAGNLDRAASIVSALRQLDPTDTSILYTAHRIYSDLAGESMLSIAMLAPKSARMRQVMAHEMARQGNIEGAIANYREALKLDPRLPGLHFELAEALSSSPSASDQAEVEREYKAALADNPFDGKAECRLGEIALRASDLKGAFARYSRALELQPNDAEANLGVAKTLSSMSRPKEAQPYLKRAAQLEPFNAATHYRLSLVYRALGRAADAERELSEYQKYKEMKERLKQVYEEMRLQPVKREGRETDVLQNLP